MNEVSIEFEKPSLYLREQHTEYRNRMVASSDADEIEILKTGLRRIVLAVAAAEIDELRLEIDIATFRLGNDELGESERTNLEASRNEMQDRLDGIIANVQSGRILNRGLDLIDGSGYEGF